MATVLNDQNKDDSKPLTASTANVGAASVSPSSSGAPAASGQFSTLQKYLGANSGAGSRIAGLVGNNLQNEANQQNSTTQRELGEAGQANQTFSGLTGQTQGYTGQLNQPATGTSVTNPANKAYDVNSYSTNLSGQKAIQDIAANQDALKNFQGITSGETAAKTKAESEKQAQEALNASNKAYDTNKQRQADLSIEPRRQGLVSDVLNTKNQRLGVQALDNSFLSQDKSKTLGNVQNALRQNVGGLAANQQAAGQEQGKIAGLDTAQQAAQQGLTGRLSDMQKEYQDVLNNRVGAVNTAKDARQAALEQQFGSLRDTNSTNQDFANLLGLTPDKVSKAGVDTNGIRLFNVLKDQGLGNFLDTDVLKSHANSGEEVANKGDVDYLNTLSKVLGTSSPVQESRFSGEQVGNSSLPQALNDRINQFNTNDVNQQFGSGVRTAQGNNPLTGWIPGTTPIYGAAEAQSSLGDVLKNIIGRRAVGAAGFSSGPSFGGSDAVSNTMLQQGLLNNLGNLSYDPNSANTMGQYNSDSNINNVINQAQQQAVSDVQNQANTGLQNMGYNNLLKIIGG